MIDVIYNVPDVDVNKNPLQVVRVTMWTGIILGFLGFGMQEVLLMFPRLNRQRQVGGQSVADSASIDTRA